MPEAQELSKGAQAERRWAFTIKYAYKGDDQFSIEKIQWWERGRSYERNFKKVHPRILFKIM